eukprot:10923684-Lingulodinium_polyedra.AAC.1
MIKIRDLSVERNRPFDTGNARADILESPVPTAGPDEDGAPGNAISSANAGHDRFMGVRGENIHP